MSEPPPAIVFIKPTIIPIKNRAGYSQGMFKNISKLYYAKYNNQANINYVLKNYFYICTSGEMAEWSNAAVLKTVEGHTSGVRIPLSPLNPRNFPRVFICL